MAKKIIYISGIITLIIMLIAILVSVKLYNKPHTNVHASQPDYIVSAGSLVNEFNQNEDKANKKYLDKVIQVEGFIENIDTSDGNAIITLSSENSPKNIICTLVPGENKKALGLKKGQQIEIKGICTGFLFDVILVRAVIVN